MTDLDMLSFTTSQLRDMLLRYWFAEQPISLEAAKRELDKLIAAEITRQRGNRDG